MTSQLKRVEITFLSGLQDQPLQPAGREEQLVCHDRYDARTLQNSGGCLQFTYYFSLVEISGHNTLPAAGDHLSYLVSSNSPMMACSTTPTGREERRAARIGSGVYRRYCRHRWPVDGRHPRENPLLAACLSRVEPSLLSHLPQSLSVT